MKIYDITQELFSCVVYPGDPAPQREVLCSIPNGSLYNLTAFSMCAHNGTHIDAPYHFLYDGKTVEQLSLEKMVGYAYVVEHAGLVKAEDARNMLATAKEQGSEEAAKRILIKGEIEMTDEAAEIFAAAGISLIGCESQSIGPSHAPMAVHKILLAAEIVPLEGIRLQDVPCGVYFLSAVPITLAGADGAPCRAILIEMP